MVAERGENGGPFGDDDGLQCVGIQEKPERVANNLISKQVNRSRRSERKAAAEEA